MSASQPTQYKKSARKKPESESLSDESAFAVPSSSGLASARGDDTKARGTSSATRKQHSQRGSSKRTNFSDVPVEVTTEGLEKADTPRRTRVRNTGSGRTVGARMFKQMEPTRGSEDVFVAMGETPDGKFRRPKPLSQVHQNRNFNRNVAGSGVRPTPGPSSSRTASSQYSGGFGPPISSDVLDDICFRFLINIPEEEKSSVIRICFQIELAHWFYVDFYCKGAEGVPKCTEIGLREFIRQIFNHCDFLSEFAEEVDQVIEQWREYKSSVPTYGAILLDSSLNYVLLVQGYYARNSWGFPKGKMNESEEPTDCAAREVAEEVGFDISDRIKEKRLIQKFLNETLTRLYIITDVPVDYPFAPRTRNEIGKVQWFSVWDLPLDRNDQKACERTGLAPKNFYTVLPFVSDLQAYITKQQNRQNKSKAKAVPLSIGVRSASAFDPVLPQHKPEVPAVFSSLFQTRDPLSSNVTSGSVPSLSTDRVSPSSAFFKPLSTSTHPVAFTGPSFMQLISAGLSPARPDVDLSQCGAVARPVPTVLKPTVPVLGRPVYEAAKRNTSERKVSVAEGGKEESGIAAGVDVTPVRPKETGAQRRARRLRNRKSDRESDWDANAAALEEHTARLLHTSEHSFEIADSDQPLVSLCDAWKSFKIDVTHLFANVI